MIGERMDANSFQFNFFPPAFNMFKMNILKKYHWRATLTWTLPKKCDFNFPLCLNDYHPKTPETKKATIKIFIA